MKMKITIDIPEYGAGEGVEGFWEEDAEYKCQIIYGRIELSANKNAMISFAKELLYFAYNDDLKGNHIDFEPGLCKEGLKGHFEFSIFRLADDGSTPKIPGDISQG